MIKKLVERVVIAIFFLALTGMIIYLLKYLEYL